ncbi:MAG: aminoglycoside phosphotransferase family protein [Sneathiella sp.]
MEFFSLSGNRVFSWEFQGHKAVKKIYANRQGFKREKFVLGHLHNAAIRCPKILAQGEAEGQPYLILSSLSGRPATEFDGEDLLQITKSAGAALRVLERAISPIEIEETTILASRDTKLIRDKCNDHFEGEALSCLHTALQLYDTQFGAKASHCLNHRDYRLANMMWDTDLDQPFGLLDMETACWGPSGADLGRAVIEDFKPKPLQAALLGGYGPVTDEHLHLHSLMHMVEMTAYLAGKKNCSVREILLLEALKKNVVRRASGF